MKNKIPALFLDCLIGLVFLLVVISCRGTGNDFLTQHERNFLKQREGKLEVLFGYEAPPNAYHDSAGQYVGLLVDFLKEIEGHLGFNFVFRDFKTWDELIKYSKTGRNFIVVGIARTEARSRYLSFTDPFIKVPYVIVTRKASEMTSMGGLIGSRVCTVVNYAVNDYINDVFPSISTIEVADNLAGLRAVSTGDCDAMVVNQMYASYLIESQGITNLKVAGESGYLNRLSAAVSTRDPELFHILDKAVDQINPKRQQELYRKWVSIDSSRLSRSVLITMGVAAAAAVVLLTIFWFWSMSLRRQVEKQTRQIRAGKEQFETAITRAPVPMVITDSNHNIVLYNDKFIEQFGYTLEDISTVEEWWQTAYPEEAYRKKVRESWEAAAFRAIERSSEVEMQEWDFITKDGSVRRVEFKRTPLGKIWLIAMNDTTERKRAEEQLRRSEAKYRDLVENINDVIYSVDQNGQMTYLSPSIKKVVGYEPSEIIGSHFSKFIHPDDLAYTIEQFASVLNGHIKPNEYRILAKSGEYRWIRSSSKPVFEEDNVVGISGAFTDITDRKRLESELVQSRKMESIGTLAGGIAHDFNNILSAIIGYIELAFQSVEKDTALYNYLNEIFLAGGRAKELVNQILTFSRQADQEHKPVQLKLIVKEVLKFLRASLPSTIEIRQDIQDESLIMADPTQIHQVIMNLCTNAEHAMREKGGVLTVTLESVELEAEFTSKHLELKPGAHLLLTVSDTGDGIPQRIMDRIFDPFFTTKEKSEGTGMGLSVVHGIIGSCGGTITVSSKPGRGATFQVYFPIVENVEKRILLPDEIENKSATGTERILFVDDEPVLTKLGKHMLESLGYEVVTSTSSNEALELFKADPENFDLVISDMTMPNMTGDILAQELMRINPKIPVILCTGYSARIDQEQAIAMGVRAFVIKPMLKTKIAKTIRKVLNEKQV